MMNTEKKSVNKWFWAWQDEKEEVWLEQMSRKGWHLKQAQFLGRYEFIKGEPKNYAYRLDFNISRKDFGEYLQLFSDAGWEHIGKMGGWQYFRIAAEPGTTLEIFTDNESKIKKYQRLIAFLLLLSGANVPALSLLSRNNMYNPLKILFFALFAVYVIVFLRIYIRIKELKKL